MTNATASLRLCAGADPDLTDVPAFLLDLAAEQAAEDRAELEAERARRRALADRRRFALDVLEDVAEIEARHAPALRWYADLGEGARAMLRALLEPELPPELRAEARRVRESGPRDALAYAESLRYRRELVRHVGRVHELVSAYRGWPPAGEEPEAVAARLAERARRAGPLWVCVVGGRVLATGWRSPSWGWVPAGELRGDESAEDLAALLRQAVRS